MQNQVKLDGVHPIVRAVAIAFGFVFIHPFEDGNGRIHRFLIHDILSRDNFVPAGMIIPVSAHMVNNMKAYDEAKELMKQKVDMPDRLIDSFIRFTHQNNGTFPKRRRKDFYMLEDDEIEDLQNIFQSVFVKENLH